MRPSLIGLALLSALVGACGGVAPTASAPTAAHATASAPATPVARPSQPVTTGLDADIDIGGRTLHLVCVGPSDLDEPTIMLEAGLGDSSTVWAGIMRAMESAHRLCAYDRAGLGQSEPATTRSVTAADHVADLRALVEAAGLPGPLVIGTHSYGAIVAILYAGRYPDSVAGLLLVDPRSPRTSKLFRDALPPVADDEPDGLMQLRYSLDAFEADPLLNRENLDLRESYAEASRVLDTPGPSLGDRPVLVLSAGNSLAAQLGVPPDIAPTFDGIWLATQQELADESTAGSLEVVQGAGHYIQADRPDAVVDGIERILAEVTDR